MGAGKDVGGLLAVMLDAAADERVRRVACGEHLLELVESHDCRRTGPLVDPARQVEQLVQSLFCSWLRKRLELDCGPGHACPASHEPPPAHPGVPGCERSLQVFGVRAIDSSCYVTKRP